MQEISWVKNTMQKKLGTATDFLSRNEIAKAKAFHKSFPEYTETPLHSLENLAKYLKVGGIYVKDESQRFGLNTFKVLGGSFAMAKYMEKHFYGQAEELTCAQICSPESYAKTGQLTFVTATDGNHGRGVAWAAKHMGHRAVVYMPKGSSLIRLKNILAEGAEASITDLNYDEAVRLAAEKAKAFGWIVVQDTAWEGYEEIPTWIMQGYGTIADEAMDQLNSAGIEKPTHVFLQAGVGSFAAAIQGYFATRFGDEKPKTAIVEPNLADCLYKSVVANDGKPKNVTGDMATIMAGLACGEPNILGWEILRDYSDMFFSCPDEVTARGMRLLGNPLAYDKRIISGESGAVTTGLLSYLLQEGSLKEAQKSLGIDENSKILLISTEGDTDPEKYRDIVWDGLYASTK